MFSHATLGERGAALKVYDEAVKALQEEIGVDPMPETIELARQIKLPEEDWRRERAIWVDSSSQSPITSPFVGRGVEIDQFTRLLTLAAAGHGQMTLITGEPGIGKSRLVSETVISADQQGFYLLSARCSQVEQAIPYQPLIDLAQQVIALDDHWRQLAPVWLRELAILIPEVSEVAFAATSAAAPSDEPDENQQGRLFQAIFHLFEKQADRHKLLLVIEDIHWADSATLHFLHYLTRHIVRVPILLIFTLRARGRYNRMAVSNG
jgi:predicted ATPase